MPISNQASTITFLNAKTCGIYKGGAIRYKTDPKTGKRTQEIDNELLEAVECYLNNKKTPARFDIPEKTVFEKKVLVPTYYDDRYNDGIRQLLSTLKAKPITLGELITSKVLSVRGGHGSPPNDQRTGTIPYVKVSDIRGMRVNVNPTNLLTRKVAENFWRGKSSGLQAYDILTPNRASNNIGEFAMLLPGEENIVLTKEVFVFRVLNRALFSPYYLMWALSLKAVRDQWKRIVLMQTNREDCGKRHLEIVLPRPKSKKWADEISKSFKDYYETIGTAKVAFDKAAKEDGFDYIASVFGQLEPEESEEVESSDEAE